MISISQLYESYAPDVRKFELRLKSLGYDVTESTHDNALYLQIDLPDGTDEVPEDLKSFSDHAYGVANLLMVDAAVGYDTGNYVSFIFPYVERKADIVYHVTSAHNIDSIRESGLLRSRPGDTSDNIIKHETEGSFRDRKYRAVFVTTSLEDTETIKDMFDFTDPVLITMDGSGMTFYSDPLMPDDMDSIISFKDISPDRIISTKLM